MKIRLFLILLFFLWPALVMGQIRQPTEAVDPGFINYSALLSLFVSPKLLPACEALKKGNLSEAETAFAAAVKQNPDDLAARLGLLQAAKDRRHAWLLKYRREAQEHPSAANDFTVGVLAWYNFAEKAFDSSKDAEEAKKQLAQLARSSLQRAYAVTHLPIVGMTLTNAYDYIQGDSVALCEDMLKKIGGIGVYNAYSYAKKNGWRDQRPPIPTLSGNNLGILASVVKKLWSKNSGQVGISETRRVNGQLVTELKGFQPFTPEQNRARAFLDEWIKRLNAAADAMPPQQASVTGTR